MELGHQNATIFASSRYESRCRLYAAYSVARTKPIELYHLVTHLRQFGKDMLDARAGLGDAQVAVLLCC
jgi:hypothetical protein